jgi:hypothetical protein
MSTELFAISGVCAGRQEKKEEEVTAALCCRHYVASPLTNRDLRR